jgi:hypothetical protein
MEKKFINMCVFSLMAKGLKVAADGAAGAGGARQQKPPQEWYTIVVYEKPRSKTEPQSAQGHDVGEED